MDSGERRLGRDAGSKGSLHSLLQQTDLSPRKAVSAFPPPRTSTTPNRLTRQSHEESTVIMFGQQLAQEEKKAGVDRLSQSYSQPRSALATRVQLEARDSERRGELEWLDRTSNSWRPCWCVLKDGFVRCSVPWCRDDDVNDGVDDDKCDDEKQETASSSSPGYYDPGLGTRVFALEELAFGPGLPGRDAVTLSLTRVTLVATDPLQGHCAFRVVVGRDDYGVSSPRNAPTEFSFRATTRETMIEWLFGFHRSLSIVVSRLRSLKQQQQQQQAASPAAAAAAAAMISSTDNANQFRLASPQSGSESHALAFLSTSLNVSAGTLHKKTSCRRRFGSPMAGSYDPNNASPPVNSSPRLFSSSLPYNPVPLKPISLGRSNDEGVALYRKSSARPHPHSASKAVAASGGPGAAAHMPIIADDFNDPSTKKRHVFPNSQEKALGGEPREEKADVAAAPVVAKYVPPHLRTTVLSALPPKGDAFEETGDEEQKEGLETVQEDADAWRYHRADTKQASEEYFFRWRSGACCERGQRQYNEDACVEVPALYPPPEEDSKAASEAAFYAVYDGHSGLDAVQRCEAELHGRVREKLLLEKKDSPAALAEAFAEVDAAYCADAAENCASLDAGATALACVLQIASPPSAGDLTDKKPTSPYCPPRLVVANCGDCAVVLSRRDSDEAVPLSRAHAAVPGSEEAQRVLDAGGWITTETDLCVGRLHAMDLDDPEISEHAHERVRLNEIHRVCGEVAVTRAIGDVDFKGWGSARALASDAGPPPCFIYPENHPRVFVADLLVPTPDIVERTLDPNDDFIVMATDGLWDVVDPQEAVDVARNLFHKRNATPTHVAQLLVQRALRLGSGDNITVLVLQFDVGHHLERRPPPIAQFRTTTFVSNDTDDDDDDEPPRARHPPPIATSSPQLLPTPSPSLHGGQDDLSDLPFELSVQ